MTSWEIVTKVLLDVKRQAKAGVSLQSLDTLAEQAILQYGGRSYNKGYKGLDSWLEELKPKEPFPCSLVCNVNSTICHGYATEYKLKDGDTVCFDLGVEKDGLCGDGALMVEIGTVSGKHKRLLRAAKRTLFEGLAIIKHGTSLADVGARMEHIANSRGFVIMQTFSSHGIGKQMHEDPNIPNYYTREKELEYFEEGKMYCLEPILTSKDIYGMKVTDWSFVTRDGKRSAMWEMQFKVTRNGIEKLTKHI